MRVGFVEGVLPVVFFYVLVQCFFLPFDVLCGGVSGSDFPLTFTVDVWIEWG